MERLIDEALPGLRGLDAWRSLLHAHASLMRELATDLARKALEPARSAKVRNDVPVLPRRPSGSRRPTMKLVNELRDEA